MTVFMIKFYPFLESFLIFLWLFSLLEFQSLTHPVVSIAFAGSARFPATDLKARNSHGFSLLRLYEDDLFLPQGEPI